jgi:DNA repair/transcription protein MET18/MMS19
LLKLVGNFLSDFLLSRIRDDAVGVGAYARALLALEGLGQWDQARVMNIMNT